LRDYGTGTWEGGDAECDHIDEEKLAERKRQKKSMIAVGERIDGSTRTRIHDETIGKEWQFRDTCGKCGAHRIDQQLGLENSPEEYVAKMVEVFREVRRVLRKDGTCWCNMGDSYAGSGKGAWDVTDAQKEVYVPKPGGAEASIPKVPHGLKPKDLCGIPWRLAFALQTDGWWLRQDIIWAKPNPMPESVTDRCTKAHEYVFLLSKSARYYYDADAVREPVQEWNTPTGRENAAGIESQRAKEREVVGRLQGGYGYKVAYCNPNGRNLRSVWTITTQPFPEAHFATFPEELPRRCIKAGTSEKGCCPTCGKPWVRIIEKSGGTIGRDWNDHKQDTEIGQRADNKAKGGHGYKVESLGWRPSCACGGEPVPCTVLDPFAGAGTTGLVADQLGRNAILIELKPEYADMAERRIRDANPMFVEIERG
jgi:DNA modification methylase